MGFTSDTQKNTGSKDPDQVQEHVQKPAQVIQDAADHAHAQDKTGSTADAPDASDVLTLSDGTQVICGRDAKGRRTVPDEIMDAYYKELPNGTRSEDGRQAYNGGLLTGFEAMDAEQADDIRRKGQAAQAAAYRQRQSIAQTIDDMLKSAASSEDCERLGLKDGATKQDALVAAMFKEALQKGTVRAADFLRDTVGEQPVNRQQIEADIMTQADKALMERIEKRLGIGK